MALNEVKTEHKPNFYQRHFYLLLKLFVSLLLIWLIITPLVAFKERSFALFALVFVSSLVLLLFLFFSDFMAIQLLSKRQRVERLVRERIHRAMDNLLEGAEIIGRDYRYLYLNQTAANYHHRAPIEMIGKTLAELYPEFEKKEMFPFLRRCLEEGVPHQMERMSTEEDGTPRWFEQRIEPVNEGAFILSLEITARKLAEIVLRNEKAEVEIQVKEQTRALQEERARLHASLNSLQVGFIITNKDPEVVFINSTAKRLLYSQSGSKDILHDPSILLLEASMASLEEQLEGVFDLRNSVVESIQKSKTIEAATLNFRDLKLNLVVTPIAMMTPKVEAIGAAVIVREINNA